MADMTFAKVLDRLRDAVCTRSQGLAIDRVVISRRDLQELLRDYNRIDNAYRSLMNQHSRRVQDDPDYVASIDG